MGTDKLSRRRFFDPFGKKQTVETEDISTEQLFTDNPLFEKYARKTLGPRIYHSELLDYGTARVMDDSLRVGNVTSGVSAYTGAWTEWEVLHLLRRTGFGFKKSFVDTLLAMTPDAAVEHILNIDN